MTRLTPEERGMRRAKAKEVLNVLYRRTEMGEDDLYAIVDEVVEEAEKRAARKAADRDRLREELLELLANPPVTEDDIEEVVSHAGEAGLSRSEFNDVLAEFKEDVIETGEEQAE